MCCGLCGTETMQDSHTREEMYVCPYCGQRYHGSEGAYALNSWQKALLLEENLERKRKREAAYRKEIDG